MNEKKKKKNWGTVALFVVVVAVAILVALGLAKLFETKETRISEEGGEVKMETLDCSAGENEEMFFKHDGAKDVKQNIKVAYQGDVATELFYTYEADFGSPEAVNAANARLHANYNFFMGKNVSDFTDQFMEMGDALKISVHSDANRLGSQTARIFFISTEEFNELDGYKVADLKKIFEKKGFSCKYSND